MLSAQFWGLLPKKVRVPFPTRLSILWNSYCVRNLFQWSPASQSLTCFQILSSKRLFRPGQYSKNRRAPLAPKKSLTTTLMPILLMVHLTNDYYNTNTPPSRDIGVCMGQIEGEIDNKDSQPQATILFIFKEIRFKFQGQVFFGFGPDITLFPPSEIIVSSTQKVGPQMNKSEIILNIEECYPFGHSVNERHLIKVRRLAPYTNQDEYNLAKKKIEVLKNLSIPGLVQLLSVLEDENTFHLIYEYVPFKLHYDKQQHQYGIRSQLQEICTGLQKKNVVAIFEPFNLGVTQHNDIKYYLDISHISFQNEQGQLLKVAHAFQINRLIDCLCRQPSSAKTEPNYHLSVERETLRKAQASRENKPSRKHFSKNTGNGSQGFGPLEMLKKIEDRLAQLRKITKKYTPAMRETFKSKDHLRETVKENWKAEKIDSRKMSGHTIYTSMFMSKETAKRKNNERRESSGKDISEKAQPSITPPKEQVKLQAKKKEPATKTDFQQIQKKQFMNYFASKQTYVHEFLGVLGDQDMPPAEPAQAIKFRQKSNTILQSHSPTTKQNTSLQQKKSTSPSHDNQPMRSPPKPNQAHPIHLRDRVTNSIKNSDLAMMRFRKNSAIAARK